MLIASVGFNVDGGEMRIVQIQGSRGNSDLLKPFKWERALVAYAVQWAEENGFSKVWINSVRNNCWFSDDDERGRMHYDVTAQRVRYKGRKFQRDEESGNYVMELPVLQLAG